MIMSEDSPRIRTRLNNQAKPNAAPVPRMYIRNMMPTLVTIGTRSDGTSAAIIKR